MTTIYHRHVAVVRVSLSTSLSLSRFCLCLNLSISPPFLSLSVRFSSQTDRRPNATDNAVTPLHCCACLFCFSGTRYG